MTLLDLPLTLTAFASVLRDKGVRCSPARVVMAAQALVRLRPVGPEPLYWATRLTLCTRADDIDTFNSAFRSFFVWQGEESVQVSEPGQPGGGGPAQEDESLLARIPTQSRAGAAERIDEPAPEPRLSRETFEDLADLIATSLPDSRSMRRSRGGRRELDLRRTVRLMGRHDAELIALRYRRRVTRPRRVLLLLDVSRSMMNHVDPMLRFAHALVRRRPEDTEVFTLAIRSTRITDLLRADEVGQALASVYRDVSDRGDGTRLGESVYHLLRSWGGRTATRSAITVLMSDGWIADQVEFGFAMPRLARRARRVISFNPAVSSAGYRPPRALRKQAQHIDEFLAGRDRDAFRRLADAMTRGTGT